MVESKSEFMTLKKNLSSGILGKILQSPALFLHHFYQKTHSFIHSKSAFIEGLHLAKYVECC